jgi:excisionase family DNA binding protein
VRSLRRRSGGLRMTLTQAAALLGVTAATLRQQIANGKLRASKRGRDWWVTRGEVARYQRESQR